MATQTERERLGAWSVVLDPPKNIDRRKCHRTVPMQVLSLGLSRTGTLSMHDALETLGYPTYHYTSIVANPMDADVWLPILQAKFDRHDPNFDFKKSLDQVLGDCSAVTDNPCAALWKELVDAYPDAKVVLVPRDETKWARSINVLFDGVLNPVGKYVLPYTDPLWYGRIANVGFAWMKGLTGSLNNASAKQNAIPAFRKHYADIQAYVPKERLLEFRLEKGWEPLCDFLGKDVPDVPFPHINEAASLERAIGAYLGRSLKNSLVNIAGVIAIGAVAVAVVRRYVWGY